MWSEGRTGSDPFATPSELEEEPSELEEERSGRGIVVGREQVEVVRREQAEMGFAPADRARGGSGDHSEWWCSCSRPCMPTLSVAAQGGVLISGRGLRPVHSESGSEPSREAV